MINIPENTPTINKKFVDLITFFNKLEKDLQYPNCSGYTDQKWLLQKAQSELIMWGIL